MDEMDAHQGKSLRPLTGISASLTIMEKGLTTTPMKVSVPLRGLVLL